MRFLDATALKKQLDHQQSEGFDLESIPWDMGIDNQKFLLPLDKQAVCFPGADSAQRLVLSQFLGMLFNSITSEMESVAYSLKEIAWRPLLDNYPANQELYDLGEQFFAEERKHSQMLLKYNQLFCENMGIDPKDLRTLFPHLKGTRFKNMIQKNALKGGHAFWWVVATTEDVAIKVFAQLNKHQHGVDPLYFYTQKLHFEEESKHASYAFMILDMIQEKNHSARGWLHLKSDLLKADFYGISWLMTGLRSIYNVEKIKNKNPFFKTLASCIPLLKRQNIFSTSYTLWRQAPYISLYLNKNFHRHSLAAARKHGALTIPHPAPVYPKTFTK